jgi:hypothetical protein
VLFQASATDAAGVALIGDRGTSPGNLLRRIAYLERFLAAATDIVAPDAALERFEVTPNPAVGRVRFRFAAARDRDLEVDIHTVGGRCVRRLVLPAGRGAVEWDGRDARGAHVAHGSYVARIVGAPGAAPRKFIWAH